MDTNFPVQQDTYREKLRFFFSDDAKFARLKRLLEERKRNCSMVFFFVKEFEKGALVTTEDGTVCCLLDEYKTAMSSFKKRFYDFQSKPGKGELVYMGERNPLVVVREDEDEFCAPLPCLMALYWFIQRDFDLLFWRDYERVSKAYKEFFASVKQRYARAHRERRARAELQLQEMKKEKEEQLVKQDDSETPAATGKEKKAKQRRKRKRVKLEKEEDEEEQGKGKGKGKVEKGEGEGEGEIEELTKEEKRLRQEELSRLVRDLRRREGAPRAPKTARQQAVILHERNFLPPGPT